MSEEKTTDREALLALADRVEAYDPKSSLDNRADEMPIELAVAKAFGLADETTFVAHGSVTGYMSGDGVGGFGNPIIQRYTRSLDAAATLVPAEAMRRSGDSAIGLMGTFFCDIVTADGGDYHALAYNEACAITSACLRALAGDRP